MNKQSQIDSLQEQIWKLQSEQLEENRAKYLPEFVEKCKVFYGIGRCYVEISKEFEQKLLKECVGDGGGFNHFSIKFDKELELCYDDHETYLRFNISGLTAELPVKMAILCKKYGIKLDFSKEFKRLDGLLNKVFKDIDKTKEIAKLFEN